jgi:hypothetical protein
MSARNKPFNSQSDDGLICFTPATSGEWGAAFDEAREYHTLAGLLESDETLNLQRETTAQDLYNSLSRQARELVDLGRLMGARVQGVTIERGVAS